MSSNDAAFHTAEPAHLGGELMHADAEHVGAWLQASVLEATGLEPAEPELQALAKVCALDWSPMKTNGKWRRKRETARDKFEASVRRVARNSLKALKEDVLDVDEVADDLILLIDAQLDRRGTPTVEPPGASAGCDASGAADEEDAPQEEVAADATFAKAEEALRRQLLARGEARLLRLHAPKKSQLAPSKSKLGLDGKPLSSSWTVKLVPRRAGHKYPKVAAPRGRTAPRPADWDSANEDSVPPLRWAGCRSRLGRAVAIATAAWVLGTDGATAGRGGHFDAKMAHPFPGVDDLPLRHVG